MPIYDFDLRLCLNVRKIAVRVTKNAQPAAMRADYDVSRSRFNLSLRRGNIPSYIQSRAGVRETEMGRGSHQKIGQQVTPNLRDLRIVFGLRMKHRSYLLPAAAVVVAIAIFVADTVTDLEIAVAVLYVVVVLMSVGFCRKRGIMFVFLVCMSLTVLSYFLTQTGDPKSGLINCGISLIAIAATTALVLKIQSAQTAANEAREQLAHIARVTTLGEMTASIAHEVNQPLTAILTSANAGSRWLTSKPPNTKKAIQAIDRIARDANRASEVVGRIRALTKGTPPKMEWVNINEVIQEVVALSGNEIKTNQIALTLKLSDAIPLVLGDHVQLQQVLLNLIVNAVEAMRAGGERGGELVISSKNESGEVAIITVCDSGIGLRPDMLDQIFDAFYTTKAGGTGMGLAICRAIAEAHGGRIWATTHGSNGANFHLALPIKKKEAA